MKRNVNNGHDDDTETDHVKSAILISNNDLNSNMDNLPDNLKEGKRKRKRKRTRKSDEKRDEDHDNNDDADDNNDMTVIRSESTLKNAHHSDRPTIASNNSNQASSNESQKPKHFDRTNRKSSAISFHSKSNPSLDLEKIKLLKSGKIKSIHQLSDDIEIIRKQKVKPLK
jgi:PHD/YefM family antitoxin component YafN of YafNO toxin-antitoxin module